MPFDATRPLEEPFERAANDMASGRWNQNVTEFAILIANIGVEDAARVWARAAFLWSLRVKMPFYAEKGEE